MLTGKERKELRGLVHAEKASLSYGKEGLSESFIEAINLAFSKREVLKMKFNVEKEKKKEIAKEIEKLSSCENIGFIGNNAIFYKKSNIVK